MATCPSGHTSATDDYCDVCGAAITDPPPTPVQAPAPVETPAAETCAACGAPRVGRFCEDCGHDSLSPTPPRTPAPPRDVPATSERPELSYPRGTMEAGAGGRAPHTAAREPGASGASGVGGSAGSGAGGSARGWHVSVEADRAYFDRVLAQTGPDAAALTFPEFCPPRRFDLVGAQVTIGRRSRSRGIFPTVDLVGPPEDPGVSHSHALLVPAGDGWSVVDLGSTNGTTVNDEPDPLRPNTPRPLREGDRVHVGAWTTITLHKAP
ncbi:MAG: FHA domain-containing protein [Saccharothrix sp.]|nr:FHA domain-containing protein [Saccharothrix sp.]